MRSRLLGQIAIVAPVLGLVGGVALAVRGRGATRAFGFGLIGASATLALTRWQLARLFTEKARYVVEERRGGLEIRRYAPSVQAETFVEASEWSESLSEGVRRLAAYIFGENEGGVPIDMTADADTSFHDRPTDPFIAALGDPLRFGRDGGEEEKEGEKIEMTAPVVATLARGAEIADRLVAVVMPRDRSLSSLPAPKDGRVHLREVPGRRLATLRFAGAYDGDLPAKKREELLWRVRAEGLAPIGDVTFAGYDSPQTLPFLRRNEVMVEVLG